jgi:hypothetical protein
LTFDPDGPYDAFDNASTPTQFAGVDFAPLLPGEAISKSPMIRNPMNYKLADKTTAIPGTDAYVRLLAKFYIFDAEGKDLFDPANALDTTVTAEKAALIAHVIEKTSATNATDALTLLASIGTYTTVETDWTATAVDANGVNILTYGSVVAPGTTTPAAFGVLTFPSWFGSEFSGYKFAVALVAQAVQSTNNSATDKFAAEFGDSPILYFGHMADTGVTVNTTSTNSNANYDSSIHTNGN